MFEHGLNPINKADELCGLYKRGSFRAWKIHFAYYSDATYIYFGSKEEAQAEAAKLVKENDYIYKPSIRELKTL